MPAVRAAGTAAHATTGASVLAIVGDVDPDEAAAMLAREFGALASCARRRALPRRRGPPPCARDRETRAKQQTALALLFPGPTRRDPERVVAQLLAGIASGLGGRFFDELRDRRSLAYTVHAFAPARRLLAGPSAPTSRPARTQEDEARAGLLARVRAPADVGVTADELERAQTYALGTHAIAQQSGGAVLGDIDRRWLLGESGWASCRRTRRACAPSRRRRSRRLAARYFDPARRVEGVVRGGEACRVRRRRSGTNATLRCGAPDTDSLTRRGLEQPRTPEARVARPESRSDRKRSTRTARRTARTRPRWRTRSCGSAAST